MVRRHFISVLSTLASLLVVHSSARGDFITYSVGGAGRTATADFSFTDSTHLQIILTETTPAAALSDTGAGVILTSIGFLLPGDAVIVLPGTVTIEPGSSSVGFSGGSFGAGADVSGEWGAIIGGEKDIGNGTLFDFVSTLNSQVTRFAGDNRDGSESLDGPQGGLLDDSAARGGLGVIDNAVKILLTLDADPSIGGNQALSAAQQATFLSSLSGSVVEYGSDAFFVVTPEPSTMTLAFLGGISIGGFLYRKRKAGKS